VRRKAYVPVYKPDPPPKPRYKARQAPLRVFVTFLVADGERTQVQRGVVPIADYLAARRWARQAIAYGSELRGAGWVPQRDPQRRTLGHRPALPRADRAGSRRIAARGCQPGATRSGPGCRLGGSGRAGGGGAAGQRIRRRAPRRPHHCAGGGWLLAPQSATAKTVTLWGGIGRQIS